jgi:hypothetical protein
MSNNQIKNIITPLLAISSICQAEFVDGNKLLTWIESSSNVEQSTAYGYVAGVADVLYGSTYCPPPNVTVRQITDMTRDALISVPSMRDKSADVFVAALIKKKWPCQQKGTNI